MKELLAIFQDGKLVYTKQASQDSWINNSVISSNMDSRIIEIELKEEYLQNRLKVSDSFEIKTSHDGNSYLAKGSIMDIDSSSNSIKINIDSLEILDSDDEKRIITRYHVAYDCFITGPNIPNYEDFSVINISSSGLGLLSSKNIPIGEDVFINVILEEENILRMRGRIVRKKASGYKIEYGANATPVEDAGKETLNELLKDLDEKSREEGNSSSIFKKLKAGLMKNN